MCVVVSCSWVLEMRVKVCDCGLRMMKSRGGLRGGREIGVGGEAGQGSLEHGWSRHVTKNHLNHVVKL